MVVVKDFLQYLALLATRKHFAIFQMLLINSALSFVPLENPKELNLDGRLILLSSNAFIQLSASNGLNMTHTMQYYI